MSLSYYKNKLAQNYKKQISECYLKPLTVTRLQQTRCPEVCPWRSFWLLHLFLHGLYQINNFASNFFGGRHSQFSFSINKREMSTIFLGWL